MAKKSKCCCAFRYRVVITSSGKNSVLRKGTTFDESSLRVQAEHGVRTAQAQGLKAKIVQLCVPPGKSH